MMARTTMAFAHGVTPINCARSTFSGCALRKARANVVARPARAVQWTCISSNDLKNGTTIELDGTVFRVNEFLHVKPGKGAAFVRTKLRNMKTGNIMAKTFRAGESVDSATLDKVAMQHTYVDGGDFVFMNMESFEEERMGAATIGEHNAKFLKLGMDVEVLKHNEDVLGVELPKNATYEVTDTEPGIKGNTATNALKPCTLETGAQVMVPLFINIGEKVKVNVETGKYVSRDNE